MESTRAYFAPATGFEEVTTGEASATVRWVLKYVAACASNDSTNPEGVLCTGAVCSVGEQRGLRMWVSRKPEGAADSDYVRADETICIVPGSVVTLDDLQEAATTQIEAFYERLGQPDIKVEPEGTGLVNLPVIASARTYAEQEFPITQPLPGRIVAQPGYDWTWSNGDKSTGPGNPYTPSVSPLADPDHYTVTTVYSETGSGHVTLDLRWAVTVHVDANPPQELRPVTFTATESFTIREARTELVHG